MSLPVMEPPPVPMTSDPTVNDEQVGSATHTVGQVQ